MQPLMDELFGAEPAATLGEAILRAKQKMNVDFSDAREVSQTFLLLGDPALVLQFGK
jgi:hypothetical protein